MLEQINLDLRGQINFRKDTKQLLKNMCDSLIMILLGPMLFIKQREHKQEIIVKYPSFFRTQITSLVL